MEEQEVKEYLKKQYPKYKGFIDHTLVAEMAMNFANMQLAKINHTRCCVDKDLYKRKAEVVNETMQENNELDNLQFYCGVVEVGGEICDSQCLGCACLQELSEQ